MTSSGLPETAQARFAERLSTAMGAAGVKRSATQFAHQFNLRSPRQNITIHGARKWLKGESIPTHDRLQTIAEWLGVSASWLRFGDGPPTINAIAESGTIADFHRLGPIEQELVTELINKLITLQKQRS